MNPEPTPNPTQPGSTTVTPEQQDRARGCLLGQVIGDSLGSLVEFRSAQGILRDYPGGVRELADGGTYNNIAEQPTDDTEMALALARSILRHGDFHADAVREAYVSWMESDPFDIGATTSSGLRGSPIWDSQANGALMRISPLAVFATGLGAERAASLAATDAAITHPHAVCGDANRVFAVAVVTAIRDGGSPEEIYGSAVSWATENRVERSIRKVLDAAASAPPSAAPSWAQPTEAPPSPPAGSPSSAPAARTPPTPGSPNPAPATTGPLTLSNSQSSSSKRGTL